MDFLFGVNILALTVRTFATQVHSTLAFGKVVVHNADTDESTQKHCARQAHLQIIPGPLYVPGARALLPCATYIFRLSHA